MTSISIKLRCLNMLATLEAVDGNEFDRLAVHLKIGGLLRGFRQACHVTQADMARRMGITASKLSGLERGRMDWTETLIRKAIE